MSGDTNLVRLLPWTGAHGQPCLLVTADGGGASRLADRIEGVQLGLAERLLVRTREALAARGPNPSEVAALAPQLADALADVLLIARSRGARLGGAGRVLPDEAQGGTPAGSRAYGRRSFPGDDLASAPAARRYVRETARSWALPAGVTDDLETIAGELVANALEHSDSRTVIVTCAFMPCSVVIGVTDQGGARTPVTATAPAGPPGPDQEQGRGLLITRALARCWGTWPSGGGLTVWAEVPVETGAA
ncbi:ATP-binding protein [Streptomyces shenzhenensis]|uniref:ATP-binding protein n=1 Tax=Streptomyces shenzhenensis TaxID=943815 RepID=UPI0015F0E784|nr:ATP-binding protein [Streptomyces shenzhenensis]